jgi:hypothetical protein
MKKKHKKHSGSSAYTVHQRTQAEDRGDGLDLVRARMRLVSVLCRVGCG